MATPYSMRAALPILIGVSAMMSIGMGLRQSLGIFLQPLTHDIGISVSEFTLAVAAQNLTWGFLQPVAGALTVRFGFRPVMVIGVLLSVMGLAAIASAHGLLNILIGAGVLIGISLACTAAAIGNSVAARAVSAASRSTVLGIVSAAGSLGTLLAAPTGQLLQQGYGWRAGILGFAILACIAVPAAWIAGRVDKVPIEPHSGATDLDDSNAGTAIRLRSRARHSW
jgi:MFS family permease